MRRSPQRHALKGTALLSGLLFLAVSACDGSSDRVVDAPSGPGGGGTGDTLPELNAEQINAQGEGLEATIRRTTNGVPHVTADSLEELGFGQGYAQAEDHVCVIADAVLKARGERARFFGPGPDNINIITDFSYKALDILGGAEATFDELSERSRAVLRGFAAGYNQYVEDTGVDELGDPRCAGQPWVQPITPEEILAYHRIVTRFASGQNFTTGVTFLAAPPGENPSPQPVLADSGGAGARLVAKLERDLEARLPIGFRENEPEMGSNGWGIGGDLTETGRGGLLANPHFPHTGTRRLWESHVRVPGVLDVNGAGLIGYPLPQIAFNENLAWTHTVSAANRFTVYQLSLADDDDLVHIKDGEEVPIEARDIQIEVAQGGGLTITLEKTFYFSEYGPMLAADAINPDFPAWGDTIAADGTRGAFTYRDANAGTDRHIIDQWLDMGRAQNIEQFRSVFAGCGTTLWVNTMYADAEGNALYIDGSSVPNLSDAAITAFQARLEASPLLAAAFAQGLPVLDGSTSRDDWVEGECGLGIVPFENAPVLRRDDFVQNSNDTYWATNPAEPLSGFSPLYGIPERQQNLRTRLGLKMLQQPEEPGSADTAPAGQDGLFSAPDIIEALYANRTFYSEEAGVLDALLQRCEAAGSDPVNLPEGDSRSVEAGCAALAQWDGLVNNDSVAAHTFRLFIGLYNAELPEDFTVAFDPADPVGTPGQPAPPPDNLAEDPMLQALAVALERLDAVEIAYDAELGDVQQRQKSENVPPGGTPMARGAPIPWHGGPGRDEGTFNANGVVTSPVAEDTRFPRVAPAEVFPDSYGLSTESGEGWMIGRGASYHFGLVFTDDGPRAFGLLSYSQSSRPGSGRFDDQDQRYAAKDYRQLLFDEADIAADPNLSEQTISSTP